MIYLQQDTLVSQSNKRSTQAKETTAADRSAGESEHKNKAQTGTPSGQVEASSHLFDPVSLWFSLYFSVFHLHTVE